MRETEFSKGSWSVGIAYEGETDNIKIKKDGTLLTVENEKREAICMLGKFTNDESIYNAKLISCAPEMLELLNESLQVIKWYMDNCGCDNQESFFNIGTNQIVQTEQLIKKATTL